MDETTIATNEPLSRKLGRTYVINIARGAGLMTGAILAAAVFGGPQRAKKQVEPTNT